MHLAYVELPSESEFRGHNSHAAVPPIEYCPGSHPAHAADPALDLNPAGQTLHVLTFVAFNTAEAYPDWHSVHVSALPLLFSSYDPAAHGTHPSDPENE